MRPILCLVAGLRFIEISSNRLDEHGPHSSCYLGLG